MSGHYLDRSIWDGWPWNTDVLGDAPFRPATLETSP
jgi:hypothetical protein